ncbi:MAG: winged helix-turn-helix transcriptional regulator [Phycisphaerales bacterium]
MAMPPLPELFHRRWALPVLGELARDGGAKLVTLVARTGASQGGVRDALDALIDMGLARRNPGYGHPLRPEYILTTRGAQAAPHAATLWARLTRDGLEDVCLRKWSLATLTAVHPGASRFSQIRAGVEGVTDRALAGALRDLETASLVVRTIEDDRPPRPHYTRTRRAEPLVVLAETIERI